MPELNPPILLYMKVKSKRRKGIALDLLPLKTPLSRRNMYLRLSPFHSMPVDKSYCGMTNTPGRCQVSKFRYTVGNVVQGISRSTEEVSSLV
jgi:hypothetical protein